jgi:YidC/Oxa1 family membrane protein insertase
MESMKRMRDFAPALEKLKKKYKDDKVKYAQAQADFYKSKGIKPGAGCLPYLLQIVVLIAFFNVFTRTLSPDGDITQRFNDLLYAPLAFEEGVSVNTGFLYMDVSLPDTFSVSGIPFSIPGPLLILAAIIQFLSAKISLPYVEAEGKAAKKTKGAADDMQVAMQQSMIYTFPLFTLVIGTRFPSGLALYWLIFSLTQAYQQYKTQGWGGLTPWLKRIGLIKSNGTD